MNKDDARALISREYNVLQRIIGLVLPPEVIFSYKLRFGGGSFTDGSRIEVGLPEFFVEELAKEITDKVFSYSEGFSALEAISLHESGHILYSNFNVFREFQQIIATKLQKKGIRPEIGMKIAAKLLNSTEDGRIEKRVVNKLPGALNHFRFLNGTIWQISDKKPNLELDAFLRCVVTIAVTGLYPKYFSEYKGQELETQVKKIRPKILEAINAPTCKSCSRVTEELYDLVEDYLVKLLEEEQKKLEEFEEFMESLSEMPDFSGSAEHGGGEGELGEGSISVHIAPEGEGEESEGEGAGASEGKGEDTGKPSAADHGQTMSSGTKSSVPEYKEEDMEEYKDGGSSSKSPTGSTEGEKREESKPEKSKAEKAIEEAIEKAKESAVKAAEKSIAESTKKEKTEDSSTMSPEEISEMEKHSGYGREHIKDFKEVQRNFPLVPLPRELRPVALRFRKEVEKFFKTQQGLNLHRMDSGRLSSKDLYRVKLKEYNIFDKLGRPSETDAVVEICWDGSGSMHGAKQKYSAQACAIIEEGLKGFIPLKIINFSTDWSEQKVVHYLVKDFNENSRSVNYSTSYGISKGFNGGNKDGYDIRVCTQELLKRPERDKILIILSDGLPSDYNSIRPMDDVKSAVKAAREKGIYVVAMFFGSDLFRQREYKNYEYMYQKNLINSSPEEIPERLVKILKKLVLR